MFGLGFKFQTQSEPSQSITMSTKKAPKFKSSPNSKILAGIARKLWKRKIISFDDDSQ